MEVWLPDPSSYGSPAAMRAAADALRAESKRIASGVDALKSREAKTTFVGPAGDDFRSRLSGITSEAERAGARLIEMAGMLMRTADQAEADIAAAIRAREEYLERRAQGLQ